MLLDEYTIERTFKHFDTSEEMHRVKVIYSSGGISYLVLNNEELEKYILGEY